MSDKVIIDRQVLEDITDWEKDWGQPFGEFLEDFTTPLVLCGECKKWKTIECSKTKMLADIVRNSLTKYAKLIWPDHDDFCKDGIKA